MTFRFIYPDCQKCKEKIHCDRCEERLAETLTRIGGIRGVDIQMAAKRLSVDTDLSEDVLEEVLEDAGIFIQ